MAAAAIAQDAAPARSVLTAEERAAIRSRIAVMRQEVDVPLDQE